MGTKVAEIFAEIDLNMGKIASQNAEARNIFARTADDIQKKLENVKRISGYALRQIGEGANEYAVARTNPNLAASKSFNDIRIAELTAAFRRRKELESSLMDGSGITVATAGMSKYQFAVMQASYGVQDFIQQIGPMGLQGALSASANNMAMVATTLSTGTLGAFAGIGITLAAVLPTIVSAFNNTAKGAEAVKTRIDALTTSLQNQQRVANAQAQLRHSAEDVNVTETSGVFSDIAKKEAELAEIDAKMADARARIAASGGDMLPRIAGRRPLNAAELRAVELAGGFAYSPSGERARMGLGAESRGEVRVIGREMIAFENRGAEDLAAIQKEIKEREKELGDLSVDRLAKEKEILALREAMPAAAREELDVINRNLTTNDALDRKLLKIKDDYTKMASDAARAFDALGTSPSERVGTLRKIRRRADEEADAAIRSDPEYNKFDQQNEEYVRKRTAREKDMLKMERDLEHDNLGKRAQDVYDIRRKLEERRDDILKNERDPERQAKLLGMAADAAERQLAALKPIGGDKAGIAGFSDLLQKNLFGGDMTKNLAATAKNTAEQKTLTSELIGAVRGLNLGLQ